MDSSLKPMSSYWSLKYKVSPSILGSFLSSFWLLQYRMQPRAAGQINNPRAAEADPWKMRYNLEE